MIRETSYGSPLVLSGCQRFKKCEKSYNKAYVTDAVVPRVVQWRSLHKADYTARISPGGFG
eukprot:SAG22_NODE_421_length_10720_cov_22.582619_10_plen_61_part_00